MLVIKTFFRIFSPKRSDVLLLQIFASSSMTQYSLWGKCFQICFQTYLSEQYEKVNTNNNFSEWCKILLGVPQGPIPDPLLFNIFNDDFLFATWLMIIAHCIGLGMFSKRFKSF